jgi:hypothetical protein
MAQAKYFDPATGLLQGTSAPAQGSSGAGIAGGAGGLSLGGSPSLNLVQPGAIAPGYNQSLPGNGARNTALVSPAVAPPVDAAGAAAAAKAAADAAQAQALRGQVTGLVNSIKDIFNSRYGQVDQAGAEQAGKLNTRFNQEAGTITQGVTDQNNTAGATFAGRGTRDSSDYGNTVDTITKAGETQVQGLGQELEDNLSKIAAWVTQQKTGFDAQKGGVDAVLAHLGEQTDPNALATIRNTLESRIADLKAGGADNNTAAQNVGALESIAPSSARAVQLQTTLGSIVKGAADPGQKLAVGMKLIQSAGLTPDEQQKLQAAFQSDLASSDPNKQQAQQPTA